MATKKLDPLILAMHGIELVPLRDDPDRLFIAPSRLRAVIDRLKEWGYSFLTFGELARAVKAGAAEGRVALTFDDGYRSNLYELVPILEATGARATVFVVSGWLGLLHPDSPRRPLLTAEEVTELHSRGVEIGCHTHRHRCLTSLDDGEVLDEFTTSKQVLEGILGGPVEVAAYPYGKANESTRALCKRAGFTAACRISGQGSWGDPWDLPRQDIGNSATAVGLTLKRRGIYEPLAGSLVGRIARRGFYSIQKKVL